MHWKYLIAIERDLESLSRYVEFDPDNYACFSVEISRILLAAAAETDVVCKQICRQIDALSVADTINAYRDEIVPAYGRFTDFEVVLPRYGLNFAPWAAWAQPRGVPPWWTAYNKMKHERASEYRRGNLQNAISAVAGLFVATLYLYPEKARLAELRPVPELLRPAAEFYSGASFGEYEFGLGYRL